MVAIGSNDVADNPSECLKRNQNKHQDFPDMQKHFLGVKMISSRNMAIKTGGGR